MQAITCDYGLFAIELHLVVKTLPVFAKFRCGHPHWAGLLHFYQPSFPCPFFRMTLLEMPSCVVLMSTSMTYVVIQLFNFSSGFVRLEVVMGPSIYDVHTEGGGDQAR